ncbi:MAG: cold shock domain-containing protein, partial [Neisseria sp.]
MKGIIVKWDDEKGYGFIRIDGSKQEIFCHISDFSQRSPRPE